MIKSPLRYPGGKSRVAKFIVEQFPKFDEYREPFLGGGSVFIETKRRFSDKKFWVNDVYFDLFKFWQQTQIDADAVCEKIIALKNQFSDGKRLYQFLKNNSEDSAAAFFIFNRITFSGTTLSGGYSEAAFRGRFTASSIERIKPLQNCSKTSELPISITKICSKRKAKTSFFILIRRIFPRKNPRFTARKETCTKTSITKNLR